ncbi:hypothetical protein [Microbacterium sp. A1-JK]|uniref:hypothetical protein n=1 Tax=Microbacterium sp. A1-JK TaxID=3177516 RepID=UPI003884A54D
MYSPKWREQRAQAAAGVRAAPNPASSITALELWQMVLPEMFGEIEIDLAQAGIIPNLDVTLDTRSWHFTRSAITRLLDIEGTWLGKAVGARVRSRRTDLPDPDGGGAALQAGAAGVEGRL